MQELQDPFMSSTLRKVLVHTFENIPIGTSPIQELELKWEDVEDVKEIKYILTEILQYPSSDLALIHRNSNKLGILDLHQNSQIVTKITFTQDDNLVYCNCCGFLLQKQQLPLNSMITSLDNLGLSTYLYFQTLINLIFLLIIMLLIYGIFALATNIIASNDYKPTSSITSNLDFLVLSLGSKQLNKTSENQTFYYIQCWLGTVTVVVWGLMFFIIKYFQKDEQVKVLTQTKSADDYSVVMYDLPASMTQQQLQKQLDQYYDQLDSTFRPQQIDVPFKIAKINKAKPFYLDQSSLTDDQLKELKKKYEEKVNMFADWILQRKQQRYFSIPESERKFQYKQFEQLRQRKNKKYTDLTNNFLQQMKNQENLQLNETVFVTFTNNHAKEFLLYLNGKNILNIVRSLFCCQNKQIFSITHKGKQQQIKIRRAPEPEDIVWTNVGQSNCETVVRKVITYSVTLIILGGSFGVIYILSDQQNKNSSDNFLSLVISISISVINIIIQQVIRFLTGLERQVTQTKHQASLGIKSVVAQLINSIAIPILVSFYIKENLYNVNGLAHDVFLLGIINAFLMPILKVFQPLYYLSRILAWWFNKPKSKLYLNQQQLNNYFELIPFQVGYQYIYIVNLFLFVCFYASLQPIVIIFGILGLTMMYWAQKYTLFNRMKRPFPGSDLVNTTMYQLIYFGPIIFSLGNLTWSNLLDDGIPKQALVPNIISLVLAVVIWVMPYKIVFSFIFQGIYPKLMNFEDNRIFLSSEYDRLNPTTSSEAIQAYVEYVKKARESFKNATKEELLKIEEIFMAQTQQGQKKANELMPFFTQLTNSSYTQRKSKEVNSFDRLFTSIVESRKVTPQNLKKSLYNLGNKKQNKRLQFIQNWEIKEKQGEEDLTFEHLIEQSMKKSKKQAAVKHGHAQIQDEESVDHLSRSITNPMVMFKSKVIKISSQPRHNTEQS